MGCQNKQKRRWLKWKSNMKKVLITENSYLIVWSIQQGKRYIATHLKLRALVIQERVEVKL
jgi:hypothetical protein